LQLKGIRRFVRHKLRKDDIKMNPRRMMCQVDFIGTFSYRVINRFYERVNEAKRSEKSWSFFIELYIFRFEGHCTRFSLLTNWSVS
jgi:hypothetical protein